MAAKQISDGNPDGTSVGQSITDKLGFFGLATNIVQRSGSAQAAVGTSAPIAACATFGLTSTQLTAVVTLVNELRAAMVAYGLIAGA